MRLLVEAGNKVEMNFGNFSMAALTSSNSYFCWAPLFAGNGKWLLLHLVSLRDLASRQGSASPRTECLCLLGDWTWVLHSLTRGTGDFCDSVLHFCWLEQREGSPHYRTPLFAKSGPVKPFLWSLISWGVVEWGNMAGKRSCPWALTAYIKAYF